MDQMASSLCDGTDAIFIDTRSLVWERVPMPHHAALAVIDSGITHSHASGGYNTRRAECERAAALLGVASLRELSAAGEARSAALPEPLPRRVRHVVTENARVLAAVAAMRDGDATALGRLFAASHASMRDDYQVSLPEIDRMVEIADATPGVFGARLTGGGFGGSIVILAEVGRAGEIAAHVATESRRVAGLDANVLVPLESGE
jgi:galactokinase